MCLNTMSNSKPQTNCPISEGHGMPRNRKKQQEACMQTAVTYTDSQLTFIDGLSIR